MNTKLTLTVEKEVIKMAREYDKEKGQILSEIVENFLMLITATGQKVESRQLSPKVKKLRGIIKTDKEIDYKKILTEELSKKYKV